MDQNQNRSVTTTATNEQETLFDREAASKGGAPQPIDRRRHSVCFAGDDVKFIEAWQRQMDPGASFADATRDILVFAQGATRAQKVGEMLGFATHTAAPAIDAAGRMKPEGRTKAAAPPVDVVALITAHAAKGPFIATIPELKALIPALAPVGAVSIGRTLKSMAAERGDVTVQLLGTRNPGGDTQGTYNAWAFMRAQSHRTHR